MAEAKNEFQDILDAYLKESQDFALNKNFVKPTSNLNTAQILFIKNASRPNLYLNPYKKQSLKAKIKKQESLKESELSQEPLKALQLLRKYGAELNEEFNLTQLRKEWRRLAFKFHPDTCQSPQAVNFSELTRCYQILKFSFKSDQQAA